jgi:hypothetical protein
MSAPVDELVLDGPDDGRDDGRDDGTGSTPPADARATGTARVRRALVAGGLVAAVLFAAWSGHATGVVEGRGEGADAALAQARVLVWFTGEGVPDGDGRARFELFAASGSGRPLTLRRVHVGADTLTPVAPLVVPAGTSASTTAVAQVECGSARELELMRSAPGADRVGTLTAEVAGPDGTTRELTAGLLPDDTAFRTLLRLAACRQESRDLTGSPDPTSGLRITAMTARTNGVLELQLEAGAGASRARVSVVPATGPYTLRATPGGPVTVEPGGPPVTVDVRVGVARCPGAFGGMPSVTGLLTLEVSTPGLVSRARLPGWDEGAVGQAAAVALRQQCG